MRHALLAGALALAGCDREYPIEVVLTLPQSLPEPAAFEILVFRGGQTCPGAKDIARGDVTPVHAQTFAGRTGRPIGRLEPGRYNFAALGRAADCTPFLSGCATLDLEGSMTVEIGLTDSGWEVEEDGAPCPDGVWCDGAGSCNATTPPERDAGVDAEPARDAASDAALDAEADAARDAATDAAADAALDAAADAAADAGLMCEQPRPELKDAHLPACSEDTRSCIESLCPPGDGDLGCWLLCDSLTETLKADFPCFECVDCIILELFACMEAEGCGPQVDRVRCCWEPLSIVYDPSVCIEAPGDAAADEGPAQPDVDGGTSDGGGLDGGGIDGGAPDAGALCETEVLEAVSCAPGCVENPVSDLAAANCFE